MLIFKAPEVTVQRLSLYLRALEKLPNNSVLSSKQFSKWIGVPDNQIRKDLAYFGYFGIRGRGYKVEKLKEEIIRILSLNQKKELAIVGVGKLGTALLAYPGFKKDKFQVKLAFDNNPEKIGKTLEGVKIHDVEKIPRLLPRYKVKIGIITTPASAAQYAANKLIEGKVEGILNFAPIRLITPDNVRVKNVDLSMLLEILSFYLSRNYQLDLSDLSLARV